MILKKKIQKLSPNKYLLQINYLDNESDFNNVIIYNMYIFSTQEFSNTCTNCNKQKMKYVL